MDCIYKYDLAISDQQLIELPIGAILLCVQVQHGQPRLWARVNPAQPKENKKIITHGTGHMVPETTGRHIGTYQLADGNIVFHVFESD